MEEYKLNRDYYHDLIKFNFFNNVKQNKSYKAINPGDLPPEVAKRLNILYDGKFKDISIDEIYTQLNLEKTDTNMYCPLETKYVFEYCEKYGTFEYSSNNIVEEDRLLSPLTAKQREKYKQLF